AQTSRKALRPPTGWPPIRNICPERMPMQAPRRAGHGAYGLTCVQFKPSGELQMSRYWAGGVPAEVVVPPMIQILCRKTTAEAPVRGAHNGARAVTGSHISPSIVDQMSFRSWAPEAPPKIQIRSPKTTPAAPLLGENGASRCRDQWTPSGDE